MNKGWALSILLLVGLAASASGSSIVWDRSQITLDFTENQILYGDLEPVAVGAELLLSANSCLVELEGGETARDCGYAGRDHFYLGQMELTSPLVDMPTSDNGRAGFNAAVSSEPVRGPAIGSSAVFVDGEIERGGRRFARLLLFPVTVTESGRIRFLPEIDIYVGQRWIAPNQVLPHDYLSADNGSTRTASTSTLSETVDYVIVTDNRLAPALEELAAYKTATGIRAEIKLVEDIYAFYSGVDEAEQVREYLKDFHDASGRYVLLCGNETVVPVRYAYHYQTDTAVVVEGQQLCDLYFGDVTGDWEVDNDGIWGERYDDAADLEAELMVGRLPFDDTLEVKNYVSKLIAYETNPGNGDPHYLTRTFFFSSDQMRDYSEGGQHARIASVYPEWIEIDTVNGVELSSGDAAEPYNAIPTDLIDPLSQGYGIVNIVAHGRSDGFIVRSSGYAGWPKSYFLTAAEHSGHGCLDSVSDEGKPAFYYSLACDNGAFDYERLHTSVGRGLARQILAKAEGGAIGFVAQSRWGWVGSSHLLQSAFFDALYDNPGRPAIEAFDESRDQYYYYRDLVMGQNFYGDPTLKVYTDLPQPLEIEVSLQGLEASVQLTDGAGTVNGCRVLLTCHGELVTEFNTGPSASADLPSPLDPGAEYTIVALKDGHSIGLRKFTPTLSSDVGDDGDLLPESYLLHQNYPNPFNPATTIDFELPQSGFVSLTVYNLLGQEVTTLVDEFLMAGIHTVQWNAGDDGFGTASGVYFYRLRAGEFTEVKKMVLLR